MAIPSQEGQVTSASEGQEGAVDPLGMQIFRRPVQIWPSGHDIT